MKKLMLLFAIILTTATAFAQRNSNRVSVGVGCLYERGFDLTVRFFIPLFEVEAIPQT